MSIELSAIERAVLVMMSDNKPRTKTDAARAMKGWNKDAVRGALITLAHIGRLTKQVDSKVTTYQFRQVARLPQ